LKYITTFLLAIALTAFLVSCEPVKGALGSGVGGEGVLLRYRFLQGAVTRHRVEEEAIRKFGISVMPAYRQTRVRSSMLVSEKVIGPSVGGYFTVQRRIEDVRFKIWVNDNLVYDSENPSGHGKYPGAKDFGKLENAVIEMEVNQRGEVRNIRGLGELDFGTRPMQSLQKLETGNPLLPGGKVSVGDSWKAESGTSFPASQGFQGILEVERKVTLSDLTTMKDSRIAVLTEERRLRMKMYRTGMDKPWKGFSGKGEADGKFLFDIDNGRVIKGEMNTEMEISTRVRSGGSKINTTMNLNIISGYKLADE